MMIFLTKRETGVIIVMFIWASVQKKISLKTHVTFFVDLFMVRVEIG